ncbi:MAG: hypothetical protein D6701_04165, partial [Gemmatimonadetes bacterium]
MPGARDPRQDVQVYDFRRPARISKDRKRSLTAIYGLLAKSLESWIAGRVRDQIGLDLQSVEQLTFGEFMLALPSPCASYIMSVNGPAGPHQAVMDFGHEFAYFLVDRLLGGSGRIVSPDRGLTPMERMVVRLVADRIALQLSEAWEDYAKLDVKVTGFESIPEMLQVANREDTVLVANIRVTMDNTSSLLLLCLPFGILERFFTSQSDRRVQVAQGNPEERAVDQRAIERTLRTSKVTVGARLPPFMLNMRTLAAIEPGAILATGLPPESDLEIYVAGQKRFTATPGRVGKR